MFLKCSGINIKIVLIKITLKKIKQMNKFRQVNKKLLLTIFKNKSLIFNMKGIKL